MTKKNKQCKNKAKPGSTCCALHGDVTPAVKLVREQCSAITKKNKQCKNKAKPGSTCCGRHQPAPEVTPVQKPVVEKVDELKEEIEVDGLDEQPCKVGFTGDVDSDNYRTTKDGWENIKGYIPKDKVIWEPFYCDGSSGEHLRQLGFEVIHREEDFFENNHGDVVVSNPPFSKKKQVLKRLMALDKPFIMILPSMMLAYKYFQEDFANEIQIIIPASRIAFKHLDQKDDKKYSPPFAAFYFCWKMDLPKDLIWLR